MKTQPASVPQHKETPRSRVIEELAGTRHLLKLLREKVGMHPELEEAIEKVEVALNRLTLNTGGML